MVGAFVPLRRVRILEQADAVSHRLVRVEPSPELVARFDGRPVRRRALVGSAQELVGARGPFIQRVLRGSPLALLSEPDHVVEVFADGAVDGRRRRHRRRGDPHQHLAMRLRGGPGCSSQLVRRRSRLRDARDDFFPQLEGGVHRLPQSHDLALERVEVAGLDGDGVGGHRVPEPLESLLQPIEIGIS